MCYHPDGHTDRIAISISRVSDKNDPPRGSVSVSAIVTMEGKQQLTVYKVATFGW